MPPKQSTASPAKKGGKKAVAANGNKRKPTSTKPKGKTIKGELSTEPDMEQEAEEGEEREQQEVEEKKPKSKAAPKKNNKKNGTAAKAHDLAAEGKPVAIPSATLKKAISALSKYLDNKPKSESEKKSLFEDEDEESGRDYYLQITTTKFMASKPLSKPKSIQIPHKLIDESQDDIVDNFKICLFVKDNVIDSKLLEQIEEAKIPFLSKIITAKELKGEFKPFEARRKLASEYTVFLSDDYLIPTLPKLLGKVFYDSATKFPIPVKVYSQNKFSIKTLTNSVNKIINSVTYIPPVGVNLNLKIGKSSTKEKALIENAQAIVSNLKLHENNKIRSVALKTLDSPSLPLYYAEKIYEESDIAKEDEAVTSTEQVDASNGTLAVDVPEGVKLTDFEKGLLELAADPEDVEKILSKKVKLASKRKSSAQDEKPSEAPKNKKKKKATK